MASEGGTGRADLLPRGVWASVHIREVTEGSNKGTTHYLLCGKKLALQVEAASFQLLPAILSGECVYVCILEGREN